MPEVCSKMESLSSNLHYGHFLIYIPTIEKPLRFQFLDMYDFYLSIYLSPEPICFDPKVFGLTICPIGAFLKYSLVLKVASF